MKSKSNSKKGVAFLVIIVLAVIVVSLVLAINKIITPQNNYNTAISLIEKGQYKEAYNILTELGDYKDSQDKRDSIKQLAYDDMLKKAEVGETLFLGKYEQDNVIGNGKEDIEWLVLDKVGNKVLVISKYGLEYKKNSWVYPPFDYDITPGKLVGVETHYENYYKECPMRKWLNDDFYNSSFTAQERDAILYTEITNSNYDVDIIDIYDGEVYCDYKTKIERTINDKIFLLSIGEANNYFYSDESRVCDSTPYAKALGASPYGDGWALRSFLETTSETDDFKTYGFSYVYSMGSISDVWGSSEELLIRPAMWIDIP